MKKWVCKVCGYVHTGDNAPEECPVCHAKNAFNEMVETKGFACEHQVGSAKGLDEEVVKGLRENFAGECSEVGMYLAMSRQADREGYPEIAEAYKRYAFEEAEQENFNLQNAQRNLATTQFTTQCMKWQKMKRATEQDSRE